MKKENQHICIAEISSSTEPHILRGLLQAEGIEVIFLDGEKFDSDIFTQIHVPLKQKEKAQKVVDAFFYNLKLKCPQCDSVDDMLAILSKVPDVEPDNYDKL